MFQLTDLNKNKPLIKFRDNNLKNHMFQKINLSQEAKEKLVF